MTIQKEIFEEFFNKLKKDKEFPDSVVNEIKQLTDSNSISQRNILEAIKKGCANAGTR